MGKCGHLTPGAEQKCWNGENQKGNLEDHALQKAWIELHITDGQKGRYPAGLRRDIKKACPCCAGIKRWGNIVTRLFVNK